MISDNSLKEFVTFVGFWDFDCLFTNERCCCSGSL